MSDSVIQARERHININFFVRLVLGQPRVCPGDFTGSVPGTNPVKTWTNPGFSPYFTQWKPDFTGFVPGTNPVCPRKGTKGGTESLCEKNLEDRNLLKLRSLDSSYFLFLSDTSIWGPWTQMLRML